MTFNTWFNATDKCLVINEYYPPGGVKFEAGCVCPADGPQLSSPPPAAA